MGKNLNVKQQEELVTSADNAMLKEGAAFYNYISYLTRAQNHGSNYDNAFLENLNNKLLLDEFIAKGQFLQHIKGLNFETACMMISDKLAISYNKDICGELFNGFLHFIMANEKNDGVLYYIINKWQIQGRSLNEEQEIDGIYFTPFKMAIFHTNIIAVKILVENGVDVTELDRDGFAAIHRIIALIDKGSMNLNVLKIWIDNGLPVDTEDKYGKKAIDHARKWGLNDLVEILNVNVEIEPTTSIDQKIIDENDTDKTKIKVKDKIIAKTFTSKNLTKAIIYGEYEYFEHNFNENYKIIVSVGGTNILKCLIEGIFHLNNMNKISFDHMSRLIEIISGKIPLKYSKDCSVALFLALFNNNVEQVELLAKYADINYKNGLIIKSLLIKMPHGTFLDNANLKHTLSLAIKYGAIITDEIKQEFPFIDLLLDEVANDDFIVSNTILEYSPLTKAFVEKDVAQIKDLALEGMCNLKFRVSGNKDFKEINIIDYIRLFWNDLNHELCAKYIAAAITEENINSEPLIQILLHSLINKQEDFVKVLLDNKLDINYNNSEILQTLTGAGAAYSDAIHLAILNGALINHEVVKTAIENNTLNIIASALSEYQSVIKAKDEENQKQNEIMKKMLTLIKLEGTQDHIKLIFLDNVEKMLELYQKLNNDQSILNELNTHYNIANVNVSLQEFLELNILGIVGIEITLDDNHTENLGDTNTGEE